MISNIASFPHLNVRRAQSKTPSNLASSFPCFSSSFWFCTRSLTRSIGAADVFEMAAAVPERKKFSAKPSFLPPDDILSNVDALADARWGINSGCWGHSHGTWLQTSENQSTLLFRSLVLVSTALAHNDEMFVIRSHSSH